MTQSGSPTGSGAEFVREMARNFWYSAILRAAIKLDVFALLEGHPLTSQEVADSIGASPRYTQAFLDCCVVLDLLIFSDEKFTNSPTASDFWSRERILTLGTTPYTIQIPGRPGAALMRSLKKAKHRYRLKPDSLTKPPIGMTN